MSETTEVTPFDLEAVRKHEHLTTVEKMQCCEPDDRVITEADQAAINWVVNTMDDMFSEIERLRQQVEHFTQAFRLRAGYKAK